jgi:hypothetical protein
VWHRRVWLQSPHGRAYLRKIKTGLHVPERRPKGPRQAIIRQVATEYGISINMVDECWDEHRQNNVKINDEIEKAR